MGFLISFIAQFAAEKVVTAGINKVGEETGLTALARRFVGAMVIFMFASLGAVVFIYGVIAVIGHIVTLSENRIVSIMALTFVAFWVVMAALLYRERHRRCRVAGSILKIVMLLPFVFLGLNFVLDPDETALQAAMTFPLWVVAFQEVKQRWSRRRRRRMMMRMQQNRRVAPSDTRHHE